MASTIHDQTLSSHASTSTTSPGWEVFLSFRDIDTGYSFSGHLYAALDRHGIRTFMNDPELCSEEVTSDAWRQAIQESKTYVVVFSENYAYAPWCLDELVEILECCKSTGRLVVPLYYYIDPSVVHDQSGSFRDAFEKHQTSFDIHTLEKWRVALTDVASLPGHQVCKNLSEADIIKNVVDGVSPKLNPMPLDVAKDLVGLDSHIEGIAYLLSSDQEDVIRIGIHGMGGVGKTTLSKAVFNQNYQRFQGSCFLENVREVIGIERGLECLQQQLINDVLKCQNIEIDNVDQGIEMIRARICPLKVLIVIDDLDDPVPLEYLEGPFAFGSIVMITTRNEDLLDLVKVETRYKVNELGDAESRQLFSQHAFADNKISDTFMELSQEILEHAGGLPLALKVFGSQLLNQFEGGQRCINKLKQASIDEVEAKLLISFDALKYLDPMLQDIFLDIACFFIGWKKEEVAKIMETCYAFVNRNIDILKKRCLLTINNRDELGMHDLLRDMGRRIACNNSPNEPGKHSRLWESKDIQDVLKEEKGTEAIEGIIPQKFYYQDELEGESFAARTFITMHKLRFLYLGKVALTGSFKHTFEDLRLLFWECCPLHCLPSEFHPQKLVILSLPCSKMKTMWELHMVSEVFENLKTLNMVHSLDLMTTPDFTKFPRLEILNLEGCKSLKEVHISIGSLGRLVFLNLFGCVNLRSLPGSICSLTALNVLKVGYCNSLEALPTNLGKIKSLKELNAESLTFSRFPDSIGHLSKLVELKLSHNENLRILPNTICNLKALRVLNISCCKSLEALPTELGCLESLEELDAKVLSVSELPDSIGRLSKLVTLRLSYNKNLRTLPDTICSLRALEVLDINGCKSLEALPIQLGNIESLKQFNAECLTVSKLPDSIGRLSKLVELRLSFNIKLKTLPDTMSNLRALEVLHIQNCYSLETLPIEFGYIESLKELNADGLIVRKLPDSIGKLGKLVELRLRYNSKLESLPDSIRNLRELEVLDIGYCRLEVLPSEFGNIESLKELNAEGLMVSKLPDSIGRLSKLVALRLSHSKNLETIQDAIFNLRSLELLTVDSCTKLGELPDQLWNITNLKKLDTTGATLLKNGPGISNHVALSLKKLDISKTVLAFLPSSMSQLLNLENLDLKDCHHLLSITKLPPSLKWIQASGCTSLIRLPNLSNLKQLEILELTDCSGLTVIQGLEELTSIKILGLRGCNSSVLAYIFTERFFQGLVSAKMIPSVNC
ncbi:TMV resistance protein N-like isoform X2 [Apium graveolens]|uniref:TMV resistance protein N-like isoform X2 n=1 Tax=Apium graveolens TaxID=4045 RepID=UPI003D7BE9A5